MKAWLTRDTLADLIGLAGVGCVGYGAWLIYPPSAFILVGIGLVAIAFSVLDRK